MATVRCCEDLSRRGTSKAAQRKTRVVPRRWVHVDRTLDWEEMETEVETRHQVFSFPDANKVRLKTADMSNAYFHGDILDQI